MPEIGLTKGFSAVVDEEDFEWLSAWNWFALKKRDSFYAARSLYLPEGKRSIPIYMHRVILHVTDKRVEVDHRDGNPLNNRRSNLRKATHGQNLQNCTIRVHNTSGFVGVFFNKITGKFYCRVRRKTVGTFGTPEEAANARDEVARKEFGEFGTYNFPREGERPARNSLQPL